MILPPLVFPARCHYAEHPGADQTAFKQMLFDKMAADFYLRQIWSDAIRRGVI